MSFDLEQWKSFSPALFAQVEMEIHHPRSLTVIRPGAYVRVNSERYPEVPVGTLGMYLGNDDVDQVYVAVPEAGVRIYPDPVFLQAVRVPPERQKEIREALQDLPISKMGGQLARFSALVDAQDECVI